MNLTEFEKKINDGYRLRYDEALELMCTTPAEQLYELAHRLRTRYQGKRIDTCSIMNARSGRCSENCKWCAQSKYHHTHIEVYPLVGVAQALADARHNADKGVRRFSLVTSGRTLSAADTVQVCEIYSTLRREVPIGLCASMGLLSREQLVQLKESGVERYHCNMETAPSYFPQLCTTHTPQEKMQTIRWAKQVGMQVCSGGIIGMGETAEQRIEFAVTLQQLDVDSIPVNVLNPIEGTPLGNVAPLEDQQVLVALAMMRIVNPTADIRLAGGRNMIKHLEERALQCGVSASIVGDLLTTTGSDIATDQAMFRRCGFEL